MKRKRSKFFLFLILGGLFLYSASMIVVRLHYTELGYRFEEVKSYERALQEEQVSLRAQLSKRLSPQELKERHQVKDFAEPEAHQIVVIP